MSYQRGSIKSNSKENDEEMIHIGSTERKLKKITITFKIQKQIQSRMC